MYFVKYCEIVSGKSRCGWTVRRISQSINTVIILLLLFLVSVPLYAQPNPESGNFFLVKIAEGFHTPLYVTHAGDESGRLFVVEQSGLIRIIQDGLVWEEPFLDVRHKADWQGGLAGLNVQFSETGLLGMAFHPDYEVNGIFFIYYTDHEVTSVLARYRVSETDPNQANPDSEQIVLTLAQPSRIHNGGMLAFGPDGYLYLALGDGGAWHFAFSSQLLDHLLGSILRIDVSTDEQAGYTIPADNPFVDEPDARPEIWSYGLRNPWRFSFDRVTGDLWIGDVGNAKYEEVNYQPASSKGGENYGWPLWDAAVQGPHAIPRDEVTFPAFYYSHEHGLAVIAGYVYRGAAIADLYGVFLFGDFATGRIWTIYRRDDGGIQVAEIMKTEHTISSFGEDEEGELYLVDYFDGSIWKFVPSE